MPLDELHHQEAGGEGQDDGWDLADGDVDVGHEGRGGGWKTRASPNHHLPDKDKGRQMATVLRIAPGALERVNNATCCVIGAREGGMASATEHD